MGQNDSLGMMRLRDLSVNFDTDGVARVLILTAYLQWSIASVQPTKVHPSVQSSRARIWVVLLHIPSVRYLDPEDQQPLSWLPWFCLWDTDCSNNSTVCSVYSQPDQFSLVQGLYIGLWRQIWVFWSELSTR